jgi:hypothetical protein
MLSLKCSIQQVHAPSTHANSDENRATHEKSLFSHSKSCTRPLLLADLSSEITRILLTYNNPLPSSIVPSILHSHPLLLLLIPHTHLLHTKHHRHNNHRQKPLCKFSCASSFRTIKSTISGDRDRKNYCRNGLDEVGGCQCEDVFGGKGG